jgi:hypothetical protein
MKGDFSRSTFRSDRPYSSVRMQQGRVPLDADWNEQVDITDYTRRRAIADIIGGCCIPDSLPNSFAVSISGGNLRVAGGRAWVHGILAERDGVQTIPLPTAAGTHIVYLEVFDRHVTAIEDPDIREIALGGPDTATRTATVVRAAIAPVAGTPGCAELRGFIPAGQTTGELTASTGAQPPDTPCVVPAAAGYARLENQLYRVEIHRSGTIGSAPAPTFKWSRDNGSIAAPWLALDGDEIVIPDAGRDDVLGFHANRWVELGHDALDAAGEPGVIVEVVARRTDSDGHFRLQFDAHGQVVPDPATLDHPKVRRWDHDAGSLLATGAIPVAAAGAAIAIEGGIEVEFSAGTYRAGDYWLIPARTFSDDRTGDILWPRDGGGNALAVPPHGVARFFCRLAIVSVAGATAQIVEDCRRTFPSLCGLDTAGGGGGCCCTVTVGPTGDVATIAEALGRLPPEGGEICVLPGVYRERVILDGRRDVTIHGCGRRTRIVAPGADPAFSLRDVDNIAIESLTIEALLGSAIFVDDGRAVTVEDVLISVRDQSAIAATDVQAFALLDSVIVAAPRTASFLVGRPVAVFVAGTDVRIERNRISALTFESTQSMQGGGVQIGGGSERVVILRNEIDGGFGPGILLGSVSRRSVPPNFGRLFDDFVGRNETDPARAARSETIREATAHFASLRREPGTTTVLQDAQGFLAARLIGRGVVSDGDLTGVQVLANNIRNMGGSGITSAHFFDLVEGEGDFISVHGLEIADNVIEDCLRVRQQPVTEARAEDSAVGGIAIADADDLVIRDNTIDRNGGRFRTPACGVFVLHSVGLEIHRNRIRHNGVPPQQEPERTLDRRGGIVVGHAEVPTREVRLTPDAQTPRHRQDGTPAARIHDNIVVAPEGRAIELIALGPVSVQGNQVTALGSDFRNTSARSPLGLDIPEGSPLVFFTAALGGAVVSIFNLGVSNEVYLQLAGFAGLNLNDTLPQPDADPLEDRPVLAGGNIQFADNQVVLDALDGISTFALSAISLFTLDDVGLSDNQSDCDLVLDLVGTNALVFGFSVRTTSNRFKEGLINAFYSAMTLGYLNWTTDNHGTHCFVRVGIQPPPLPGANMVLRELLFRDSSCERAGALERRLHTLMFPNQS